MGPPKRPGISLFLNSSFSCSYIVLSENQNLKCAWPMFCLLYISNLLEVWLLAFCPTKKKPCPAKLRENWCKLLSLPTPRVSQTTFSKTRRNETVFQKLTNIQIQNAFLKEMTKPMFSVVGSGRTRYQWCLKMAVIALLIGLASVVITFFRAQDN